MMCARWEFLLKILDTPDSFQAIFDMRDNCFDLIFAFLYTQPFKNSYSKMAEYTLTAGVGVIGDAICSF